MIDVPTAGGGTGRVAANADATPTTTPPAPDPHALLDRLHRLAHHVKGRLQQAVREQGDGLAPMEARALAFFARRPGSTQSNLVQHAGRDKAQIARIVKLLQQRGLLQAAADLADGRVLRLSLTSGGRAMQRRMHQQRTQIEIDLMAGLSPTQRRQLLGCLDRLLAVADQP